MNKTKNNHYQQKRVNVALPHPWYSEANILKAGASAFLARIPFYSNPFNQQPFKSWWIRGFKRAEKHWNEQIRFSQQLQETLYEESQEG